MHIHQENPMLLPNPIPSTATCDANHMAARSRVFDTVSENQCVPNLVPERRYDTMNELRIVRSHPILTFYLLAFLISWTGVLLVVGPGGIPGRPSQLEPLLPKMMVAMLAGPVLATLLTSAATDGTAGYRKLIERLSHWRVRCKWVAFAFFAAPLVTLVTPLAFSIYLPDCMPRLFAGSGKGSILLVGISAGLMAGCFEELGWTGFAIPRIRLRCNALRTGLIVGMLWGAWHLLLNFWTSGTDSSAISMPSLAAGILFSFGVLPPYRVLMVWVWDHTASLPLAMFMHMALTTSSFIFAPARTPGMIGPVFVTALAVAMWVLVALRRRLHLVLN